MEELGLPLLVRRFKGRVALTWVLVLAENALLALIPLFIGRAIDGLLAGDLYALVPVGSVFGALTVLMVLRRLYDTRAYGTMRVFFGAEVVRRLDDRPVSEVNARVDMSREFVDFLEGYVPEFMTSSVQLVVATVILLSFDANLGVSALCALVGMAVIYGAFHGRIYRVNGDLNGQRERQVSVLAGRKLSDVVRHLTLLRRHEVRFSDTEAILYGLIFLVMGAFIIGNLALAARIDLITAGSIFAIVSYSWEFVESGFALPDTLQQWTRLTEIRQRLNPNGNAAGLSS